MSATLEIALAHAALGREVFPFRLGKDPKSGRRTKMPLVKWQANGGSADPDQIRRWATTWPRAQWGWRLPVGLVVVDIDDAAEFASTGLVLPDAPSQSTPSGGSHHLYVGDARQTVKETPGIDTRVGGRGWVGLYSVDSFAGEPGPAPEWLLGEKPDRASGQDEGDEGSPMTHRPEILGLAGRLAEAGASEAAIIVELRTRHRDGRIMESDPARPWTDDDWRTIAHNPPTSKPFAMGVEFAPSRSPVIAAAIWTPLREVDELDAKPLLLGKLDPQEHTILFGTGGSGKGVLAAWWAARLSLGEEDPIRDVLVLDYERHGRYEWRPRVRLFGGDQEGGPLDRVHIYQPDRPVWQEVDRLLAEMERFTNPYLIIDSIGFAVGDLEAEKATTATKYIKAIQRIGVPTLSLAHTTKADADPRYPFGSVYWHNGARVTMSLVGDGTEPRVLTNKKTNQRAPFAPVEINWEWSAINDNFPRDLTEKGRSTSLTDLMLMVDGELPRTVEALVTLVNELGILPKPTTRFGINGALTGGRHPEKSAFEKVPNTVPQQWVRRDLRPAQMRRTRRVSE
jgi:hypothetical protein